MTRNETQDTAPEGTEHSAVRHVKAEFLRLQEYVYRIQLKFKLAISRECQKDTL
jgi:hypothetical protein